MTIAKISESGRSMVEMLGMLAVIGVLSVAGISSYNSAMNRLKANELLNEAQKRATVVAMQFASGKETASLAEFSDHSTFAGGSFDDGAEIKQENNRFKIILTNVLPEICQQMKSMIGTNTTIRKIACNTAETRSATLLFNSDMGIIDPIGDPCNNIHCKYDQICLNNTCLNKEESLECITNEDCKEPGKFCNLTLVWQNRGEITEAKCETLGNGTSLKNDILDKDNNIIFKKGTLLLGPALNYISARNWCLGHNKDLIDLKNNRLQCHNAEVGTSKTGNCTVQGIEVYESPEDRSFITEQLASISGFSFSRFWTKKKGYNFYLPTGYFYFDNTSYPHSFSALCE